MDGAGPRRPARRVPVVPVGVEELAMNVNVWGVLAGVAAIQLLPACLAQTPPRTEQAPAPSTPAVPPAEFATADDLLKALETADADLKTLSSELLWTKDFFLGGDSQTRKGHLHFVDERNSAKAKSAQSPANDKPEAPDGLRKFAIKVEATVTQGSNKGEGRLDKRVQEYVFDGVVLVERYPAEKRIIKHQLQAKVGADPLKIGEGPIPLPVGQKRADILERFNVELLAADKDLVPHDMDKADAAAQRLLLVSKGCVQLKLVPKPEFEKECTFKQARLWYRRDENGRLLPRMARAVDKQDNTDTVMLTGVEVNGPVSDVFDTNVPPGWEVQIMGAANPVLPPATTRQPSAGRDEKDPNRR